MDKKRECRYKKLMIRHGKLKLELHTDVPEEQIAGLVLREFPGKRSRSTVFEIPVRKIRKGNGCILFAESPVESLKLGAPEWGIYCKIYEAGIEKEIPCVVANRVMRKLFYIKDRSLRYLSGKNEIVFLLLASDYSVHLVHRQHCLYDDRKYRIRECMAKIIYSFTKKYWDQKKIWVFFEKECRTAQDNGYWFFKYCVSEAVKNEIPAELYYVLDTRAIPETQLDPDIRKHLLKFYSWKYMMYLQAADLLVSSESREQAVVWRNRNSFLRDMLSQKPLFFLQHGVIGLKRLPHFARNRECSCERFITSSRYEKSIVEEELGYSEDEVLVTGLARYDRLEDKSKEEKNARILVMPTWREWLDDISEEEFLKSRFYQIYSQITADVHLSEFLKQSQMEMHICLHPKAERYRKFFCADAECMEILSYDQIRLNDELMKASLLITDYSSVAWDMFYMDKPVVFFMFDEKQYLETTGSYLDFETDLFGPKVKNAEELLDILKCYRQNGFQMGNCYQKQKKRFFSYHDRQNCARIWKELKKYWENR